MHGGSLPVLILVSGMAASGKSTLSEHLGAMLEFSFFMADGIKEMVFNAEDADACELDEETSDRLGGQSFYRGE